MKKVWWTATKEFVMRLDQSHLIRAALVVLVQLATILSAQTDVAKADSNLTRDYVLGPGDQIVIHVPDAEEISDKPVRIGANGMVSLPVIGRVQAAGLTAGELEEALAKDLTVLVKHPQVQVSVLESLSEPVSVLGEVRNPGMYQLQGRKTLVQVLSLAGGPAADAGYGVKITRRIESGAIPLPGTKVAPGGAYSEAVFPLHDIMSGNALTENILVMPNDVITVPRTEMVYVLGDVQKSGAIELGDTQKVGVLRALSLAGGLAKTAKPTDAKILRLEPGDSKRYEIPVNLKTMLAGDTGDVQLQAEDILFVPDKTPHNAAVKVMEAMLQVGTGVAILSATHY
jgi:polysaccharide export outer membrane protein